MAFELYQKKYIGYKRAATTARIQRNGTLYLPPDECDQLGIVAGDRLDVWYDSDKQRVGLTRSKNGGGVKVGKLVTARAKYVSIVGLIRREQIHYPKRDLPVSIQTVNGEPMIVVDLKTPAEAEELTK